MISMILAALAIAAPAAQDPLAPARDGKVQCYTPDAERQVCRAIGAYRFEPDGRIFNDAENMLRAAPLTILRASYEIHVRDNAECTFGGLLESYIQSIEVDGVALEGEQFASMRAAVAERGREVMGSGEYCSTYHPQADGSFLARVAIDGIPRLSEDTILWVRREDGWRVAP